MSPGARKRLPVRKESYPAGKKSFPEKFLPGRELFPAKVGSHPLFLRWLAGV
jgi:hypothetical protein